MADLKGENINAKLYLEQGKGKSKTKEMPTNVYDESDTGIAQTSE
jgi:hypothetical protein